MTKIDRTRGTNVHYIMAKDVVCARSCSKTNNPKKEFGLGPTDNQSSAAKGYSEPQLLRACNGGQFLRYTVCLFR